MCSLSVFFFAGVHAYASTGTAYTWGLSSYLQTERDTISGLFDATYNNVYAMFSKTWLNIMKSIEYQGLVCLGIVKNESLLSLLQKDKTVLVTSFKKDFVELENQIISLEEKKSLQDINNINVFDTGTTYESEKAKIKDLIDLKVKTYRWFIANFETNYILKNTDFLTSFQQYRDANKDSLSSVQNKITKVQNILTAFAEVEATIAKINSKIIGSDGLAPKIEDMENKGIASLDKSIQSLVDTNIKKYKKLQNLSDELIRQKAYMIGQYQMDFDEYLASNLKSRYNHSQYLALKSEIAAYKAKFYTSANQLNCSTISSTTEEDAMLITKIAVMRTMVNSWLARAETEGIDVTFQTQLYSGLQLLCIQKFKQRYNEYAIFIKEYIKTALQNFIASLAPIPAIITPSVTPVSPVKVISYVFTKPFKSGEYDVGIKALQNLLTTIQLYSWAIDGVYNKATKNAVYQFQLSKWLLIGYEKKPGTRWRMWPATRKALNNVTK